MKKLESAAHAAKKPRRRAAPARKGAPKPKKRIRKAPRKTKKPTASNAPPEVRRAIPLDYVTTAKLNLRRGPDSDAEELPGGLLAEGTVVKIAPQEWWYVETPGNLRGWAPSGSLRRATGEEESRATLAPELNIPSIPTAPVSDPEVRKKIAESIMNLEARRDANGHLRVYNLPPSDGGGRYEVAGINERYDPEEAAKLRVLVNAGRYDEAERDAVEYIAKYTDVVSKWTTLPSIEAFLRDCVFNRGPGGAAKILQMALGVKVDGAVGPETLAALRRAEKDPARLLAVLRVAREHYEMRVVGRRPEFWKGLVNRWDKSLAFAQGIA
jgi:Predicted Peptidoglycan domain